jgi:hypothetical protein
MSNFFSFSLFPISKQKYVETSVSWFFTSFFLLKKNGKPLVPILKMVLVLGAVPLAHKRKKERKKEKFGFKNQTQFQITCTSVNG